jgi:hypothetical protein
MRRMLVPVLSLVMLMCLTVPSQGWWLFHHPHGHHVLHGRHVAQPVAVPLTVGFQLPGGIGINLTPDGSILDRLRQQRPETEKVTINSDVTGTIDRISTKTTNAADKLDALVQAINSGLDDHSKLEPVERATQAAKATGGGVGENLGGGLVGTPKEKLPKLKIQ